VYLPEYQAKEILGQYGVTIPEGSVAYSPDEAEERARRLSCEKFAVKAQILAGGRGAAGGVIFAATPSAVREAAEQLIGKRLVTEQTDAAGEQVMRVYVEAAISVKQSLYLALIIDPKNALPTLLGSAQGGRDFESSAREDPSILETLPLGFDGAVDPDALSTFLLKIGVKGDAQANARDMILSAVRAVFANDVVFLEINPLVITDEGKAIAVDAKMIIDDNALYRHPEFEQMAHDAVRDEYERVARANDINFVRLSGNIGVVVNGAGLGLATNDMIVDAGGKPANFMDIRTTATSFQIARGVQLLLEDPDIKVLLVNVHGGGMTVCDTVAEALGFAYARASRKPPIVFRAAGQNATWATTIMKDRRLPFESADDMTTAATRATGIAREAKR
jgi:succinyl-CoA synthetase beta subunit